MALCYNINDLHEKIASPEGSCWQKSSAERRSFPPAFGSSGGFSLSRTSHREVRKKWSRVFSIPEGQHFTNYFAKRSKRIWDLVSVWRELVICRTQQQREGKEVPYLQKDCFTASSKEVFTISPSLHNLGHISGFFHCVQHFLYPR